MAERGSFLIFGFQKEERSPATWLMRTCYVLKARQTLTPGWQGEELRALICLGEAGMCRMHETGGVGRGGLSG